MAVYLVLSFDDDGEAHEFARRLVDQQYVLAANQDGMARRFLASLRAVYKKPTKYCECTKGGKTEKAWTRGRKYGWWVCSKCGKPSKGWAAGDAWYTALGTNLIPQSYMAPETRPYGWESPAEWADLVPIAEASVEPEQGGNPEAPALP